MTYRKIEIQINEKVEIVKEDEIRNNTEAFFCLSKVLSMEAVVITVGLLLF